MVAGCRCTIKKCAEDAVVAQDRARVEMEACAVTECGGPALDLTSHAQAYVRDSLFRDCSGSLNVLQRCAIMSCKALPSASHRMQRPARHNMHKIASSEGTQRGSSCMDFPSLCNFENTCPLAIWTSSLATRTGQNPHWNHGRGSAPHGHKGIGQSLSPSRGHVEFNDLSVFPDR